MNLKQTIATGLVTVVAFGALTFMPASADSLDQPAKAAPAAIASLNPAETPQHLVWDMTYGDQGPLPADAVETQVTENKDVTDLSMG